MPLYLGGSSILNLRSLSRISRISANSKRVRDATLLSIFQFFTFAARI